MIFISPPTVDEHLNAAPGADRSILARNVVVCAIPSDQQDMKRSIPHEVDVKRIRTAGTDYIVHTEYNRRILNEAEGDQGLCCRRSVAIERERDLCAGLL